MARKSMAKWIEEAIADNTHEHKLSHIVLAHMRGTIAHEVYTWKPGGAHGADPKAIATLFKDKSDTISQDLPHTQTWNLLAFYGASEPGDQFIFLVKPQPEVNNSGLTTEAPTEQGRLQQMMRWTEAGQGQIFRRQQAMDDFGMRMIQQQGAMIERLMTDRFDAVNVMTDMMMRMANNQHELRMRELEREASKERNAALMQLAPALINTLTGKEVFPQSTADTAIVEAVAKAATPEMLGKLMELGLPDVVMAPIAKRIMEIKEREEAEAKKKKELPVYSGDPKDDVNGGAE